MMLNFMANYCSIEYQFTMVGCFSLGCNAILFRRQKRLHKKLLFLIHSKPTQFQKNIIIFKFKSVNELPSSWKLHRQDDSDEICRRRLCCRRSKAIKLHCIQKVQQGGVYWTPRFATSLHLETRPFSKLDCSITLNIYLHSSRLSLSLLQHIVDFTLLPDDAGDSSTKPAKPSS